MAEYVLENNYRRELEDDKRQSKLASEAGSFSGVIETAQEVKQAYNTLMAIKIACGASLIFAIVTYFIWLGQILGRKLGFQNIPELKGVEKWLFVFISAILITIIGMQLILLVALYKKLYPIITTIYKILDFIGYYP